MVVMNLALYIFFSFSFSGYTEEMIGENKNFRISIFGSNTAFGLGDAFIRDTAATRTVSLHKQVSSESHPNPKRPSSAGTVFGDMKELQKKDEQKGKHAKVNCNYDSCSDLLFVRGC